MPSKMNAAMAAALHQEKITKGMDDVQILMNNWKFNNSGGDILTHRYNKPKVEYWQVKIIYNNEVEIRKGLFKKEKLNIPFEFSAPYINSTREEAIGYAKFFLKDLIDNGDLPPEVVVDGKVNDDLIKIATVKVELAYMERDVSDK